MWGWYFHQSSGGGQDSHATARGTEVQRLEGNYLGVVRGE